MLVMNSWQSIVLGYCTSGLNTNVGHYTLHKYSGRKTSQSHEMWIHTSYTIIDTNIYTHSFTNLSVILTLTHWLTVSCKVFRPDIRLFRFSNTSRNHISSNADDILRNISKKYSGFTVWKSLDILVQEILS